MPPTYASALSQHQQHGKGNGGSSGANASGPSKMPLTPTAMGRWSVASKQLPPVDQIKALHVYDFDNTRKAPGICPSNRP